ncbi:MAG TPA: hypothetical protein VMW02_02630 [Thermoplasmata archaeon]|nr:hypothetical protein [Thermoplasmata archaeon]
MPYNLAIMEDPFRKNGSIMARHVQKGTVPVDKVLDNMRVGTAFSVSDMKSVLQHLTDYLARTLPEGTQVQVPFGTISLALRQQRTTDASTEAGAPPDRSINIDNLSLRIRADRSLLDRIKKSLEIQVVKARAPVAPATGTETRASSEERRRPVLRTAAVHRRTCRLCEKYRVSVRSSA